MRRKQINIKKVIQKKNEYKQKSFSLNRIIKTKSSSLNSEVSELRSVENNIKYKSTTKTNEEMNERMKIRLGVQTQSVKVNNEIKYFNSKYIKSEVIDYDIFICIPSHNRFDKILRLLNQFFGQKSKYSFKIIILNDGSSLSKYDFIKNTYPDIIYIKNDIPNGMTKHWCCYNQMWNVVKNYNCYGILQMDDDFILCDGFLDKIIDIFFHVKKNNNKIVSIAPHTWSFKKYDNNIKFKSNSIDGIGLFDINFIKLINYELNPIYFKSVKQSNSAGVWLQIISLINANNLLIHRTENSLVWHDGNDDSSLHGDFRRISKPIYTQKYIDNNLTYD